MAYHPLRISPQSNIQQPMRTLAILALLCTAVLAMRVALTQRDPTVVLAFQTKGKHTFYAMSSGKEKHDINVTIDFRGEKVYNGNGTDLEFSFDYGAAYMTVNLSSSDGLDRNVSFDFYAEDDPLVNIIDKRDLKYIEKVLNGVHATLESISRNQQFHIERDESHKATLEESESSIKWTGIVKIFFLLASALLQLWIMKGFFKTGEGQPYQPVMTG